MKTVIAFIIATTLSLMSCNRSELCMCTSENLETNEINSTYYNPRGNEGCPEYTDVSGGYRTDCGYNPHHDPH